MTAIHYRLPDGIIVAATNNGEVTGAGVWIEHPVYGSIAVDRDKLTEVRPPLPPEPPIGTVVLDGGSRAWQRVRDDRDPQWRHDGLMCGWETMVRDNGPLTALVPDPADDAPAPPWAVLDGTVRLRIERVGEFVRLTLTEDDMTSSFDLDQWHAPQAAAAILRAAREDEQR